MEIVQKMLHKSRKKYSRLSLAEVSFEPEASVLLTSVITENVNVTVETFDYVQDADDNDFFKVEFDNFEF